MIFVVSFFFFVFRIVLDNLSFLATALYRVGITTGQGIGSYVYIAGCREPEGCRESEGESRARGREEDNIDPLVVPPRLLLAAAIIILPTIPPRRSTRLCPPPPPPPLPSLPPSRPPFRHPPPKYTYIYIYMVPIYVRGIILRNHAFS